VRYCYRCNGFGRVDCGCESSTWCERCWGSREVACPICVDRGGDAYAIVVGIVIALGVVVYFW